MIHEPAARDYTCEPATVTDTWKGQQGTQGYLTLADAEAEIIRFAGFPERIEIWCLDNPATIRFTDEQGRPSQPIRVEAGNFYQPQIRAHSVHAANSNAGFNARLQVVGKWAPS